MPLGEERDITPEESKHRYDVMRYLLSGILGLLFIVMVFQVVLEIQIQNQNKNTADTERAAAQAQTAATNTDKVLTEVLKQVNTPEAQAEARRTRQRIINIEDALCKGPCPDSERKAP